MVIHPAVKPIVNKKERIGIRMVCKFEPRNAAEAFNTAMAILIL